MKDELQQRNFVRISLINWALSPLLMFFFAWPFYQFSALLLPDYSLRLISSLLFSFAFTLTILHGHVSLAIGSLHRHLFYEWLDEHPFTYGVLYHKSLATTRLRLSLLIISLLIPGFGMWF